MSVYANARDLMADAKFYDSYSRYDHEKGRYENWDESVDRVMQMHREYYASRMTPELDEVLKYVKLSYEQKHIVGSQRALQFGGPQILRNHTKLYNCSFSYCDRPEFFGECFWIALCGCGVGFSVQRHHIAKLPEIKRRTKQPKLHVIEDSIEGWATALDVLMSSYFVNGGKFPEYSGHRVYFDYSKIREKGALISGGFKAPGPEPLRYALDKIEHLLNGLVIDQKIVKLRPIHVYDVVMHAADAVISGGVRRAAFICLFSIDDIEMMESKTGDWFIKNKQRGRSNNSAVVLRSSVTRPQFAELMKRTKEFGEPGFIFVDSLEHGVNPCLSGDTWVTTPDGAVQINDLVGKGKVKLLVDGEWKETTDHGFIQTAVDYLYELKLENGATIKATLNHKFYSNGGWKELADIQVGEYIRLSRLSPDSFACFSRVFSILPVYDEKQPVYDCCVPDGHAFDANGIYTHNCVEIGLYSYYEGLSGWSFCNLSEINGSECTSEDDFYEACRSAAAIGTLQAGYTDFKFLSSTTKKIVEHEALLGVSITGWMNNPQVLFNPEVLEYGAQIVNETNEYVAKLIGIRPAARTTCVKPSGSVSVVLGTASGIHPEHSPRYIRNVQFNKLSPVAQLIKEKNPYMIEESVWSANKTDYVISFPVECTMDSVYKDEYMGVNLLERVKLAQEHWVIPGTHPDRCLDPTMKHNVSNTVTVDDWDEVEDYLFENRDVFTGVSLIPFTGDRVYKQAPNTEILDVQEITEKYHFSPGVMFASGLIVDALKAFPDLWDACMAGKTNSISVGEDSQNLLSNDWIRRFRNYASNYFNSDFEQAEMCLKDVYLLHKWEKINQTIDLKIDFENSLTQEQLVDINTMSGAACAGGNCEI